MRRRHAEAGMVECGQIGLICGFPWAHRRISARTRQQCRDRDVALPRNLARQPRRRIMNASLTLYDALVERHTDVAHIAIADVVLPGMGRRKVGQPSRGAQHDPLLRQVAIDHPAQRLTEGMTTRGRRNGRMHRIDEHRNHRNAAALHEVEDRLGMGDRKSTRLNSSHVALSRMPSSA